MTGLPLSTTIFRRKLQREKKELRRNEGSERPRIFRRKSKIIISQFPGKNLTFSAQEINWRFGAKSKIIASRRKFSRILQSSWIVKNFQERTEYNKNSKAKNKGFLHPVQRARLFFENVFLSEESTSYTKTQSKSSYLNASPIQWSNYRSASRNWWYVEHCRTMVFSLFSKTRKH